MIETTEQLEEKLSDPPAYLVEALARVPGDLMILGVAGKMGPTLARMAQRAYQAAGVKRRVIGVARFSKPQEQEKLNRWGIETIRCDLLNPAALRELPDVPNIMYMAGMKFGSAGNEPLTWAMNTLLPAMVCQRFPKARIAAFSTGNVYGLTSVAGGGPKETDPLDPRGDYAMSCLGRERMFEYFSNTAKMPVSIIRLNYACEMRYGVLMDCAQKVAAGEVIDVTMGNFNAIWQGDANAMSLATLAHARSPALVINVSGPEMLRVRDVCEKFGKLLDRKPQFTGTEAPDALITNGELAWSLFGKPQTNVGQVIEWIAHWIRKGGETLGKPTHYETRGGKY